MKRIIILEGCDRTGKSTFINKLKNEYIKKGFNPFVFHLLGPNIKPNENNSFTNDEKALYQLGKFDNSYSLIREILNENKNNIVILDRSHFSQYVWAEYWLRKSKFTDMLFQDWFYKKHEDLFKQTFYLNFYISNLDILIKRIIESPEDKNIFIAQGLDKRYIDHKVITEEQLVKFNILFVYKMFDEIKQYVINHKIECDNFDNSGSLDDMNLMIDTIINKE